MIQFGCLGFSTNPVFVDIEGEPYPRGIGYISNRATREGELIFEDGGAYTGIELSSYTRDDIIQEYKRQYKKHGVKINNR